MQYSYYDATELPYGDLRSTDIVKIQRLPSSSSKQSSFCPRITSGSEYDSSSSSSGRSHLPIVKWQGNDSPFPHMSSQHKISNSNKKSFDPFDEDFVRFSKIPYSSDLAEMFPTNNDKETCDSCTQTDCTLTCDFATSPVLFPTSGKCEAGTQYDINHDLVMFNDVEMTMEQGDSMELMDCVAQMDVVLGDKQWIISDTTLDTGSQTDDVPKYSLRSRKKSSFPDVV